jgi:transcriptional regulator
LFVEQRPQVYVYEKLPFRIEQFCPARRPAKTHELGILFMSIVDGSLGEDAPILSHKNLPLCSKGKCAIFPIEIQGERMDTTKLEFLRGTLDVLILKALVWGPLHGYAITSLIRRQSDDALLVEEGTLYPALWRLENKKLLAAEWGLSENNRKAKFYRLTAEGRRQLRQEVKTWEAYAAAVAKVLGATRPPLPEEMA